MYFIRNMKHDLELYSYYVFLSVSVCSFLSAFYQYGVCECTNIIGIVCLLDLFIIQKPDMIFHHMLVLMMVQYVNNHYSIPYRDEMLSIFLRTEISTIFLEMNYILERVHKNKMVGICKTFNTICFIITFIYYRIYQYGYYFTMNPYIHPVLITFSKTHLEMAKVYFGIYGLFLLNLYWLFLIIAKIKRMICR